MCQKEKDYRQNKVLFHSNGVQFHLPFSHHSTFKKTVIPEAWKSQDRHTAAACVCGRSYACLSGGRFLILNNSLTTLISTIQLNQIQFTSVNFNAGFFLSCFCFVNRCMMEIAPTQNQLDQF